MSDNCEQSRTCTACGKPGYHDGEKFIHTGDEAEDVSEKSTDREFEDYFASNAPVDALSKMEKAAQLLETIEIEELRRTEQAMVSSALKSLRHSLQRWHSFRDENDGVRLSEEYQGLNGSEVIKKVHEENSEFTQKGESGE